MIRMIMNRHIKFLTAVILLLLCTGSFLMAMHGSDPHDLNRFTKAQKTDYQKVCGELKAGKKTSHWIWYIFPQAEGLGYSSTSKFYAIKSREEAQSYLKHPELGKRLEECTQILLDLKGLSADQIFGSDSTKLRSSLTLFAEASNDAKSVFARALDKYFKGKRDTKTLKILSTMKQPGKKKVQSPKNATNVGKGKQNHKVLLVLAGLLAVWLGYKYVSSDSKKSNDVPQEKLGQD